MKSITKLHGIISAALIFSVAGVDAFAQNVGVGTSTPAEKLHIVGSVRSSALAGAGSREVLADPNGTLIIGTGINAPDWTILGNANTTMGTNYLGTTNPVGLDFRTDAVIRQSILSTGAIYLNDAPPLNNALFTSYAGAPTATNIGVDGQGSSMGVLGIGGTGVRGQTSLAGSDGVYGLNTNASGFGVTGEGQQGVLGLNTAGTFYTSGVAGIGGVGLSGWGVGVNSVGAIVKSDNAAGGTGIIAIGNNIAAVGGIVGGSGVAAKGTAFGAWGQGTTVASGIGIIAGGNNIVGITPGGGAGVAAAGNQQGVFGINLVASNFFTTRAGGLFQYLNPGFQVFVATNIGGTNYKINGGGIVATVIKDLSGNRVNMIAPEAPEAFFQDYGKSQLNSGQAHIDLDPVFAKNVAINTKHPLRVFIQLEGNCNGVYVTNKSATGFDVVELNGGLSNAPFVWFATANRADEPDSKYADIRFPPSFVPVQTTTISDVNIEKKPKRAKLDSENMRMKEYKPE